MNDFQAGLQEGLLIFSVCKNAKRMCFSEIFYACWRRDQVVKIQMRDIILNSVDVHSRNLQSGFICECGMYGAGTQYTGPEPGLDDYYTPPAVDVSLLLLMSVSGGTRFPRTRSH